MRRKWQRVAIYHIKVTTGSRGGGQSARAKQNYIEREGRYAKDADELEYKESGNIPAWAEDDPGKYWQAADDHERANGRLFVHVEVALPVELDVEQRRDLAQSFARRLTEQERLPYTMAIHKGEKGETAEPGDKDNPHAHLMISERGLDGHDRNPEQWFKRANKKEPERGGAMKARALSDRNWVEQTRQVWQQEANRALTRAGQHERIDSRSLADQRTEAERQGDHEKAAALNREPGVHLGPAIHDWKRTKMPESTVPARAAEVNQTNAERKRLPVIDRLIEQAERLAETIKRELRGIPAKIHTWERRVAEQPKEPEKAPQRAPRRGVEWPGPDFHGR